MQKFLKYPIRDLDRFSEGEKRKLLDAVVFYVPDKVSIFYKIISFLKGE